MKSITRNKLFFGDNLPVLREHVPDESVDLVYLDPPFNSARQYNLLFKQVKGDPSPAQITAFEDTWTWSPFLIEEFMQTCDLPKLRKLIDGLYDVLGGTEMMAYIVMMTARLVELHRVLKPTGSIYLHCDPVASHYLKVILDALFGGVNFRNEITWKRQSAHSDAKHKFADVADTLLFYGRSSLAYFEPIFVDHDVSYLKKFYRHDDNDGRGPYRLDNMASPNPRPNLMYEYKGFGWPTKGWRYELATMQRLDSEGRIHFPRKGDGTHDDSKRLALKRYLKEQRGSIVTNVWNDIGPVQHASRERRGYPTQKPLALLERILMASSKPGDWVLDPFCGCGTAVSAAQAMDRYWIGIDITYLAVREIEERLLEEHGLDKGADYDVTGLPTDLPGARALFERTKHDSHKQFEMWAVSLIGGRPREKKGGDRGIDGDLLLVNPDHKTEVAPIQVKGGGVITPSMVRDFAHVIDRERAPMGIFLAMESPTRGITQEAATAGQIECRGKRVNRLQILPLGDVLERNMIFDVPDGYSIPPSRYRQQGLLRI